jgi:RNA polymerase sigma-70 factor (ECF subfamily)
MPVPDPPVPPDPRDLTADLLQRARAGDRHAMDELFERHTSLLRRWAARRLPQWARFGMDTVDLVQETMLGLFRNIDRFDPRGEGALQAYLRQGLINRVRSQLRNAAVRPSSEPVSPQLIDDITSPLEAAIGRQSLEAYESALSRLPADARTAVVSRVELGLSYAEIASALEIPTANAARMFVARALVRLAREMGQQSSA